jgi:hypothetical protein
MEVTMDTIQETLESRIIALRDSLTTTEDKLESLKIQAEILNIQERLARLD